YIFSSGRRHTIFSRDWSSDVCSSDLLLGVAGDQVHRSEAAHSDEQRAQGQQGEDDGAGGQVPDADSAPRAEPPRGAGGPAAPPAPGRDALSHEGVGRRLGERHGGSDQAIASRTVSICASTEDSAPGARYQVNSSRYTISSDMAALVTLTHPTPRT